MVLVKDKIVRFEAKLLVFTHMHFSFAVVNLDSDPESAQKLSVGILKSFRNQSNQNLSIICEQTPA